MSDFVFSPAWWLGIVLFGSMAVVSVLEWRGLIRTPFERIWPATALGTGIVCVTWLALLVFAGVAASVGLRFSGLPFYTPALVMLVIVTLTAVGLVLAFQRHPPRWTVAPHLRGAREAPRA